MAYVKVGTLKMLPPGSATQVELGGDAVALCNVGGTLYAMHGICPHSGGPLGYGALDGPISRLPVSRMGVRLPHWDDGRGRKT